MLRPPPVRPGPARDQSQSSVLVFFVLVLLGAIATLLLVSRPATSVAPSRQVSAKPGDPRPVFSIAAAL